jgi:tetratricopeptide (TPR) repeat protein
LCRLWNSFEDYVKSEHLGREAYTAEIKSAFFARVIEEAERCGLADCPSLAGDFPLGYILLQTKRYEEAIASLQSCIPGAPHNAALYGYLGDAYWLRGDRQVARRCYREACLVDPAGIDWRHLQDEDLKELKHDLWLEYGLDPELALAWLPSHARINGLFERKVVRLHDGLKEMVDEYLALEKTLAKEKTPKPAARIFFKGMILCENGESLKFVKKIDLMQVRRIMKEANPDLFADFLKRVVGGMGGG